MQYQDYRIFSPTFFLLSLSLFCLFRFGICEPYEGGIDICNEVFTAGVDYVFITKAHESQMMIAEFLESSIPRSILLSKDDNCRKQVYAIVCNYFLIPCGNENVQHPPTSICSEECSIVEQACPSSWEVLTLGFREYRFINCSDTSSNLFPLPSCCTGVGIQDTLEGRGNDFAPPNRVELRTSLSCLHRKPRLH